MKLIEKVEHCIVREYTQRNWKACEKLAALRKDLLMIEAGLTQQSKQSYIGIDPF